MFKKKQRETEIANVISKKDLLQKFKPNKAFL